MAIIGAYLLPHPPIILPAVGLGREKEIQHTTLALAQVAQEIKAQKPATIILITPHGQGFQDAVALSYQHPLKGDLSLFGVPQVTMSVPLDQNLTRAIYTLAEEENIPVVLTTDSLLQNFNLSLTLDHGALVPLSFIEKAYTDYQLVHITYAPLSDLALYRLGMVIEKACKDTDAVVIASGDLSHRLKKEGPYTYHPDGPLFDQTFLSLLSQGDVPQIFAMAASMIQNAGECGRRSVLMLLGSLDGTHFEGELLSYEGPFGVGYGVLAFRLGSSRPSLWPLLQPAAPSAATSKDPYVRLAKESLAFYLTHQKPMASLPDYVTEEMKNKKAGVFVSFKKEGELRGCIGTISATRDHVAFEIIKNAIEAGIYDPRFYEITPQELPWLQCSVDVLSPSESCERKDLDPENYGVIITYGHKRGLLLPRLEGVDTIEAQLQIALQKAGISPDAPYEIQRFQVIRHEEGTP